MSVVKRGRGVKGRFVAPLQLFVHVLLDQVQGHVAGNLRSSTCTPCAQARRVSSPWGFELGECASSLASAIEPGRKTIAMLKAHIVRAMISQISSQWV